MNQDIPGTDAVPEEDVSKADMSDEPAKTSPGDPGPKEETVWLRKRKEKEVVDIDEQFFYDYHSLVFKPVVSDESGMSPEMIQL